MHKKLNSAALRKQRKYLLKNHIYLVFLCRHKGNVLNKETLIRLKELFEEICNQKKCNLIEFYGESDYVRLLVSINPTVSVSSLIGKLKGKSSYFLMKEFFNQLKDKVVDNHFWSSSYCAISEGINALEEIEKFLDKV